MVPPEDEEEIEERRVQAVFPIQVKGFVEFLRRSRDWVNIRAQNKSVNTEVVQSIADLGVASLGPWLTDAGMIVSIGDPEAFIKDVKRKLVGIAMTLRSIVGHDLQTCLDALELIQSEPGAGLSDEAKKKVEKCIDALSKSRSVTLAFLNAANTMLGAIQANLPAGMMSNVIKGHSGFITD